MPGLVSILAGNQFLGVFVINPAESTQTGKKIIPIMLSDAVLSPFHANAAQFEVEVDGQGILRKVGDVRVNLTSNPKRDRKIEIKAKKATADRFAAVQHDLRTFLVAQIGKPWSAELFRQATTRSEIRQVALDRTLPVEARVQFVRNAFRPMGNWQRATGNEKALTSYVGRRALTAAPVDAEVPLTVGLPETAKNIRLQDTMTQSHQVIKAGDLVTGDGATRTSSETQTIYTEVKYDETVVEKVTRWFRAGILPLRVALTVIHEKSTALLARLDIHITNAEEAARAAENAVTLVTKPETLNPSKVKAARAVFGETITKASDAFILGAEFAFNRGAIAVMRTIFGDAPIAVLVRDQKDRDFIQKFNLQLAAANRQPILMADGVEEAQAFMRAETVRLQALGVTSVKIKGLVAASEPMAVALKEKIPDTMFVTDAMFGNFLSQAGIGIGRLVADIQAQFAFRKSA